MPRAWPGTGPWSPDRHQLPAPTPLRSKLRSRLHQDVAAVDALA